MAWGAIFGLHGYAGASTLTVPHPAPDFPDSEAFYPATAKLMFREGKVVVHFCVDENGHLSGEPTVAGSSGDDDLDQGAVALAKAGNDHYIPGYEDGKAIAACGQLKVNFALRDEPRFPTLSRRWRQLSGQLPSSSLAVKEKFQGLQHLPPLESVASGDPQQVALLRQITTSASSTLAEYDTSLVDYIQKIDELGRSEDVSEAERTAFSKFWQPVRARVGQAHDTLSYTRPILRTLNELADFVETAQPPLWSASGPNEPSAAERVRIDELTGRAHAEIEALLGQPKQDGSGRMHGSVFLESVAGHEYSAASMPSVTFPTAITTGSQIADACPYPDEALRKEEDGLSRIRLHLDAAGGISAVELERSSGYDVLDTTALKCITKLQFQPATRQGTPLAAVIWYDWLWKLAWAPPELDKCDRLEASARSRNSADAQSAMICTCWEESGKPGEPRLVESTGSKRLDEGALKLAQKGLRPIQPGHPNCSAYRMRFDVKN